MRVHDPAKGADGAANEVWLDIGNELPKQALAVAVEEQQLLDSTHGLRPPATLRATFLETLVRREIGLLDHLGAYIVRAVDGTQAPWEMREG